jgi:hypothetical protein
MAIPCAFKEMFPRLPKKPKQKRTTERSPIVFTKGMANKDITYNNKVAKLMFLLPALAIIQPDNGSEQSAPKGNIKRRLPNSASFKSYLSLISGIREAQDENKNPKKKK